jgi:hypothetical protein
MAKTLRNFEIRSHSGGICNNLELVDIIYVRYKKTNSKGIIVSTNERNIFHQLYWKGATPIEFTYLPILDRNGAKYRKRMHVASDSNNFEIIPAFDISFLNENWISTTWTEENIKEFNKETFNK